MEELSFYISMLSGCWKNATTTKHIFFVCELLQLLQQLVLLLLTPQLFYQIINNICIAH